MWRKSDLSLNVSGHVGEEPVSLELTEVTLLTDQSNTENRSELFKEALSKNQFLKTNGDALRIQIIQTEH